MAKGIEVAGTPNRGIERISSNALLKSPSGAGIVLRRKLLLQRQHRSTAHQPSESVAIELATADHEAGVHAPTSAARGEASKQFALAITTA